MWINSVISKLYTPQRRNLRFRRKAKNWILKKKRHRGEKERYGVPMYRHFILAKSHGGEGETREIGGGSGWSSRSRVISRAAGVASSGYERYIGAPVCITIRKRCALLMQRCVPSLWFASGCDSLSSKPSRLLLYSEWISPTEFPRLRNSFFLSLSLFPRRGEEISTSENIRSKVMDYRSKEMCVIPLSVYFVSFF